jgi:cytochrome P450
LAGHPIRRGALVLVSPYVIHRQPDLWESPAEFRPARFEHGLPSGARSLAYCPFGAGDRSCIGAHIALAVARALVGSLVRGFRFARSEATRVTPAALATLYPGGEVRLLVERRGCTSIRI